MANPFYYRRDDAHGEALETYRRLLRKVVTGNATVVAAAGGDVGRTMHDLGPRAPRTFDPLLPRTFPYGAPRNHRGPMGNQMLARQYLARLDPDAPQVVTVLETGPVPVQELPRGAASAPPLSRYARVQAAIGDVALGHFVTGTKAGNRKGSPRLLATAGVVSLVHVGGPRPSDVSRGSIADGCFVAVDRPLDGSPQVCLRTDRGGTSGTRCIGHLGRLAHGVNVGTLELAGASIEDYAVLQEENRLVLSARDPDLAAFLRGARRVTLEVGGTPLLSGAAQGDGFLLSPANGGCFRLRASKAGLVEVEQLGDSGVIDLVFEPLRGAATRLAIATWRKSVVSLPGT